MKKHALAMSWVLVGAMTLVALASLTLSPELLRTPIFPGSPPLTQGVLLLSFPANVGAMILMVQMPLRRAKGPAIQAWRDYWGVVYLFFAIFMATGQALLLLKLSGTALPFSPGLGWGRGFLVLIGVALVAMFNRFPKLPPMQTASQPSPDPVRWAQMARLISWIVVGLGILLVLTGLVGPTPQTAPFLSLASTSFFALALLAIVYHFWRWHFAGGRR